MNIFAPLTAFCLMVSATIAVGTAATTLVKPATVQAVANEVSTQELTVALTAPVSVAQGQSTPISIDPANGFGYNVLGAIEANNGALKDFTIHPGASWSFNRAMGNPAAIQFTTFAGIPGGGWCDLASRYVQAARAVLPPSSIVYPLHGVALNGVSYSDSVVIWNTNNTGGEQDLVITNTTTQPIRFLVEPRDGQTIIVTTQLGGQS